MRLTSMQQQGFTLIELVVVMVLLGILGVAATARFQDLSGTANANALTAVVAEVQSASAINYAVAVSGGTPSQALTGAAVACATVVPGLMQSGAMPSGYTVPAASVDCSGGAGTVVSCNVSQTSTGNTGAANLLCTN